MFVVVLSFFTLPSMASLNSSQVMKIHDAVTFFKDLIHTFGSVCGHHHGPAGASVSSML